MTRPSEQARYFDLFERLLDCALLLDLDTHVILDANSSCEQVLGLGADHGHGHPITEWVWPEHVDAFEKEMRIAKRRYRPRQFDSVFKAVDGRKLVMEVTVCLLKLEDSREVLQLLAHDVTEAREIEEKARIYLKRIEELSVTDELTQLSNVRAFKEDLRKEHERSARYNSTYSVVFLDVDHFKKYNDRNGHPAGDQVLREVGAILRHECRNTDLPARYGGEEFVVLCRGVDWHGAKILADRIRAAFEAHGFAHREHQPLGCVSASVGVASFPEHGATVEEVLEHADQAVYASKQGGRNRVTIFDPALLTKKAV